MVKNVTSCFNLARVRIPSPGDQLCDDGDLIFLRPTSSPLRPENNSTCLIGLLDLK